MSEVTDALRALQAEERTVEDVAQMFRTRSWPTGTEPAKDAGEAFARENSDRDPDAPGSFAEVGQAFYTGIITIDQYEVLAQAAAEGMKKAPSTAPSDNDEPEDEPSEADADAEAEPDADAEPEKPEPGKPKKGVNPFPKKDEQA